MDLTLQQLRVVVALYDAGSFTAAAAQLHLAQPSLSRAVADIERRVGAALFERTTRRVEPTPAGREFVAAARRALAAVEAELRHVDGFLHGRCGRLRVATLPSLAAILLPAVVSGYRCRWPDVAVTIEDALAREVLERVERADADLAVTVAGPGDDLERFAVTPVAEDRFCLLVPPAHGLAGAAAASWEEIADEPFIAFHETTSIRGHVDRAFASTERVPRPAITARNIAAVAGLVAAGLGVTAVPGLVVPLTGFAGLVAVPLHDPVMVRHIVAVHPRHRPLAPAARGLLALLTGDDRPQLPLHARWTDAAAAGAETTDLEFPRSSPSWKS